MKIVLFLILFAFGSVLSQQDCYGGSIVKTITIAADANVRISKAEMDSFGKIIAAGYTQSSNLANNTWSDQQGQTDIWVTYTNLTDINPFIFTFGGSLDDRPKGFGIDKTTKDLCIVDAFITVFNSSGAFPSNSTAKLSTLYGGSTGDSAVAADCNSGLAYIAGYSYQNSPYQPAADFVSIVNISNGLILFNTSFASSVQPYAISFYQLGQTNLVAISGSVSDNSLTPTSNAYQQAPGGQGDAYLMILNVAVPSSPSLTYLSYFGGSKYDGGGAVATDANGYVFMSGTTSSTNLPCQGSSVQFSDIFLAVFEPNGNVVHCRHIGGEDEDDLYSMDILSLADGTTLILMAARTFSLGIELVAPFQNNSNIAQTGNADVLVIAYKLYSNYTGEVTFSSYLGSPNFDEPASIQILPSGRIVISGTESDQRDSTFITVMDCPALVAVSPSPSPSASVSSSPTSESGSSTSKGSNLGLIVGVVVGGTFGLALILAAAVVAVRMKSHRKRSDTQPSEPRHKDDIEMPSSYTALPNSASNTPANYSAANSYAPIAAEVVKPATQRMSKAQDWTIDYTELTLEQEIGKGAFGVVYKGRWKGVEVAVKRMLNANRRATEDLLAEAKLMTALRPHPHITQILGVCVDPLCLVTEFVHNGSLLDALKKNKIQYDNLVNIARGIAAGQCVKDIINIAGMFYLHGEGVIHRDLAARNILLDKTWGAKVSDFGMSRVAFDSASNKTESNVGPIRWMAPEAMRQRVYNHKTDVWSYGIALYELLTRTTPYQNYDLMQVAASVMMGEMSVLPEIEERKHEFPPVIVEVMKGCLQFKPEERPTFANIVDMYDNWTQ